MRLTRLFGALIASGIVLAQPVGAAAAPKPPVLEQFDARFDLSQTTTFYIVNAYDPGGGKLDYQWSLSAQCGYLTDSNGTGPSNGYQFGPPASRPSGCSRDQQHAAVITVRIVNHAGCAIVYSQGARDETQHVRPTVRAEACPPAKGTSASPPLRVAKSFPVAVVAGVLLALGGGFALIKLRSHSRSQRRPARGAHAKEDDEWVWSEPEQAIEPEPEQAVEPEPEQDLTAVLTPLDYEEEEEDSRVEEVSGTPCEEGAVRGAGNDFVAHETVLAGTIRALAPDERLIELSPTQPKDIIALAALLDVRNPLEIEVEIPLRLVTVVCTRREICRDGHWRLDVQSQTHDGPERVERLRAIVASPEELERFADQILARRLRSLLEARRRLEETFANLMPRGDVSI